MFRWKLLKARSLGAHSVASFTSVKKVMFTCRLSFTCISVCLESSRKTTASYLHENFPEMYLSTRKKIASRSWNIAKNTGKSTNRQNIRIRKEIGVAESKGSCGRQIL